eukprot:6456600-Amphidinium_carterae.1
MLCDYSEQDIAHLEHFISISRFVLVLLSKNSLYNIPQLHVMVKGIHASRQMIPINLPTFAFPSDDYYAKNLPLHFQNDPSAAQSRLQTFFKTIAVHFAVHSLDQVLDTQAAEVVRRIASVGGGFAAGSKKSGLLRTTSLKSGGAQSSAMDHSAPSQVPAGVLGFEDGTSDAAVELKGLVGTVIHAKVQHLGSEPLWSPVWYSLPLVQCRKCTLCEQSNTKSLRGCGNKCANVLPFGIEAFAIVPIPYVASGKQRKSLGQHLDLKLFRDESS